MQSRRTRTVALVSVLAGALLICLVALLNDEPIREQWWRLRLRSSNVATSRRAARSLIELAERRAGADFERGKHARALGRLLDLESLFRKTGSTEIEILFLIAECHFHLGDYEAAVPRYRRVLEISPDSAAEKNSAQRLYSIGQALLRGRAKPPSGGSSAEDRRFGIDILIGRDGLLTLYPFLFERDRALLEIADGSLEAEAYRTALTFYAEVLNDKTSDLREEGHFGFAVAAYRLGRSHAKSLFERYCSDYPNGARIDEARRYLREIEDAGF